MSGATRGRSKLITDINMVPFTDVVLVLLVIFMVTTPFIFQGAFTVSLPKASAPNPNLPEAITVSIAPGGRIAIDGVETRFEELTSKLTALAQAKPGAMVVLEADGAVSHATVVGVMGQAYAAGITRLSIAVEQRRDSTTPLAAPVEPAAQAVTANQASPAAPASVN
jgi:biopolymer transport protein ExbD